MQLGNAMKLPPYKFDFFPHGISNLLLTQTCPTKVRPGVKYIQNACTCDVVVKQKNDHCGEQRVLKIPDGGQTWFCASKNTANTVHN